MADIEAIKTRGRAFYRCTAADGKYSFFVTDKDKECPSPTDTRTVEYAARGQSTGAVSRPPVQSPPVPATRPTGPAVVPFTPESSETGATAKIILFVLAGLGIAWFLRSIGPRSDKAKVEAEQRKVHTKTATQRRSNPAPEIKSMLNQPNEEGIDMQRKAQDFLAVLNAGTDVPGGLAFRGALQAARLDYSMESLDRLDQLLRQIKTEFSPERKTWQERPGAENFCLMLAFYLGEMISRQTRQPIKWHTREQAAPFFPADNPLPVADWSRLVGIIAASICVPLGFVEDSLFGGSPAATSRAYVEERVAKLPKPPAKDENERCSQMLEAFFNDAGILGTLAYRVQLEHSRLDHSFDSLERLDQLLRSIREEIKPKYEEFVNKPDTQNFVRFVAFYIGMTTARAGSMAVKWLDFAEVKKDLPELEFQFEATSVCLLSGRFCFLLGLVTEILFHPNPQRSVPGWASEALKFPATPFVSILRSSAHSDTVSPLDELMVRALHQTGFVAAWCMFMVEGGSVGKPTVFVPGEGDKGGLFTDFGFYSTLDAGVAAARNMLDSNPRNSSHLVMSSDGYANLHTGRTDALTIELRVYASTGPSLQEVIFKMLVSCPYRNANDPKGFAIYSPKLVECSGPAAMNDAIFKHFYLGIEEFKVDGFDWFKYLDERI